MSSPLAEAFLLVTLNNCYETPSKWVGGGMGGGGAGRAPHKIEKRRFFLLPALRSLDNHCRDCDNSFLLGADDAAEKTNTGPRRQKRPPKQYGEQKGKLEALVMVADNENVSLERRKRQSPS